MALVQLSNMGNINSGESNSLNLQYYRAKYNKLTLDKFSTYYNYENQIILGFPLLRKYENILRTNLVKIPLDPKFHYRPEYLSHFLYGTTDLWYVIMFLNNMTKVSEFNKEFVYVGNTDLVSVINTLVLQEEENDGTKKNPKKIKKNYLKKLNVKSEDVLTPESNKRVPWLELPNLSSKKDEFINTRNTFYTSYNSSRSFYVDDVHSKEIIPAFSLSPTGLTNYPSIFFNNGYSREFKGRIRLKNNTLYTLNKYFNGRVNLRVFDERDNSTVVNITENNRYPEAMLIDDLRYGNENVVQIWRVDRVEDDEVLYEDIEGRYIRRLEVDNLRTNGKELLEIHTAAFIKDEKSDILDVRRLNGKPNIFFNLEYSNDLSDENITGFGVKIIFNHKGGKRTIKEFMNKKEYYNTNGELAYLKGHIRVPSIFKVESVTVTTVVEVKPNVDSISLKNEVYSLELTGLEDREVVSETFSVSNTGWYTFTMKYDYFLLNPENNGRFFKDKSFSGIFFSPTITEYVGGVSKPVSETPIQLVSRKSAGIRARHQSLPWRMGSVSRYASFHTISNPFPDKYILDFSLSHDTLAQGGGVGFIVDYDPRSNTGYMFWIGSKARLKPNGNIYPIDPEGYNIMKTGFYEVDNLYGEDKFIIDGDHSLIIKVNNFYEVPLEGNKIRLAKRGNRIKIYIEENGSFDMNNAYLDIEDIANVHKNGYIGIIAAFAEATLNIDDYFTWDAIVNPLDEEW